MDTIEDRRCDATLAACFCDLSAGHEGPHICSCEGSWRGSAEDDDVEVVAFPALFVGPIRDRRSGRVS